MESGLLMGVFYPALVLLSTSRTVVSPASISGEPACSDRSQVRGGPSDGGVLGVQARGDHLAPRRHVDLVAGDDHVLEVQGTEIVVERAAHEGGALSGVAHERRLAQGQGAAGGDAEPGHGGDAVAVVVVEVAAVEGHGAADTDVHAHAEEVDPAEGLVAGDRDVGEGRRCLPRCASRRPAPGSGPCCRPRRRRPRRIRRWSRCGRCRLPGRRGSRRGCRGRRRPPR